MILSDCRRDNSFTRKREWAIQNGENERLRQENERGSVVVLWFSVIHDTFYAGWAKIIHPNALANCSRFSWLSAGDVSLSTVSRLFIAEKCLLTYITVGSLMPRNHYLLPHKKYIIEKISFFFFLVFVVNFPHLVDSVNLVRLVNLVYFLIWKSTEKKAQMSTKCEIGVGK